MGGMGDQKTSLKLGRWIYVTMKGSKARQKWSDRSISIRIFELVDSVYLADRKNVYDLMLFGTLRRFLKAD